MNFHIHKDRIFVISTALHDVHTTGALVSISNVGLANVPILEVLMIATNYRPALKMKTIAFQRSASGS